MPTDQRPRHLHHTDTLFLKSQKQGQIEIESSVAEWGEIWQGFKRVYRVLIRFWIPRTSNLGGFMSEL